MERIASFFEFPPAHHYKRHFFSLLSFLRGNTIFYSTLPPLLASSSYFSLTSRFLILQGPVGTFSRCLPTQPLITFLSFFLCPPLSVYFAVKPLFNSSKRLFTSSCWCSCTDLSSSLLRFFFFASLPKEGPLPIRSPVRFISSLVC